MWRAPVPRQGRNGKDQSGSAHQETSKGGDTPARAPTRKRLSYEPIGAPVFRSGWQAV
jgi:hypothetical protein